MAGEIADIDEQSWLYRPSFPDEWERMSLLSMAHWVNGLAFRDFQFSDTGKPVIKIAEIKGGITGQTKFTNQTFDDSVFVTNGDMLFSWSGQPETSIDVFWWRGRDGWLNQHIFKVTPIEDLDPVFFYYVLRYLKPNFIGIARNKQTTGLGHVTRRDIENIEAAFPPLAEQKATAAVLGALDDKIELNRRMNATLEAMARALFQSWFVDFDPVRAKLDGRPPAAFDPATAALFPEHLEDSPLGHIPKGWEVKTADEISVVGIGKNPPRKEHHWFSENPADVPWMSIRDLGEAGVFISKTSEFLTPEAVEKFRVRRIPDDTVVLSFKLTMGRAAITDGEMLSNEAIAHFRLNPETPFGSAYLYCYLKGFGYDQLGSTSSIATAINSDMVRGIKVLVPSKGVADAFEATVAPLFAQMKTIQNQSRTLATLRDTLLPKLLSGEIQAQPNARSCQEQ